MTKATDKPTGLALLREAEVWLPVKGYEGLYSVSTHGNVRSERRTRAGIGGKPVGVRERILRALKHRDGHFRVVLCGVGSNRSVFVHALVLEAHVGPRPAGFQACHNNGDPSNNSVSNLRWDTAKANQADRRTHGTDSRGEANSSALLTEEQVQAIRADTRKHADIASDYGVDRSTIGLARSRRTWTHVGEKQ